MGWMQRKTTIWQRSIFCTCTLDSSTLLCSDLLLGTHGNKSASWRFTVLHFSLFYPGSAHVTHVQQVCQYMSGSTIIITYATPQFMLPLGLCCPLEFTLGSMFFVQHKWYCTPTHVVINIYLHAVTVVNLHINLLSLTCIGVCWVHSNVDGLENIHWIKYLTAVDPLHSTFSTM